MGVISRHFSLLVGIAILSQLMLGGARAQECGGPGQPKCKVFVFRNPAKKPPVKPKKPKLPIVVEPTPRKTPLPTPTPVPTPAAIPSQTPTPTPTPRPTPINLRPLSELLKNAPKPGEVRKNSIGMELVWVPRGEFMMGSSEKEVDDAHAECKKHSSECKRESFVDEKPKHNVIITAGFWVGKYEVTQGQWQAVMGDNPSKFKDLGADCPVEQVSWDDIQFFLRRLNAKKDRFEYSLPSESQWEYAARAGTTTVFAFGDSLRSSQANFDGEYPYASTKGTNIGKTVPVGRYQPNVYGLYDMHGNVWEWCEDRFGMYPSGAVTNPTGPNTGQGRVLRGGGWSSSAVRSADRWAVYPSDRANDIGFRVVARPKWLGVVVTVGYEIRDQTARYSAVAPLVVKA